MVLSIPWNVGPTVPQRLRMFHKWVLALCAGKYEIRDNWLEQSVCQVKYLLFYLDRKKFLLTMSEGQHPWRYLSGMWTCCLETWHSGDLQCWLEGWTV